MAQLRLALVGFGNVGQGLAQILAERGDWYRDEFGLSLQIVAVSDIRRGSVYDPSGLDPSELLSNAAELERMSSPFSGWDTLRTIRESNAHVVLEMAYTDLSTGEPGFTHVQAALESGKHAILSNKGPVALRFPELSELAEDRGLLLGVEATVMSGTPTLALGMESLKGAGVNRIQGILNGTTNFILTRMGEGLSYDEALREAQERGYAEADPTGDVEGTDAAGKAAILGNLVMGVPLSLGDVERSGMSHLTPKDVADAERAGEVWKLIATVERREQGVAARVGPERISLDHPLAAITGATNAITFSTDYLGDVTLVGPGAGRLETGYAMISDLLRIHRYGGSSNEDEEGLAKSAQESRSTIARGGA